MTTRRTLHLGDSYTVGTGVTPEESWPHQLIAGLRADHHRTAMRPMGNVAVAPAYDNPTIIAANGWTCDDLATHILAADLTPPYDLVTLLIGVNDQYRGYAIADYPRRFSQLLQKAIKFAGNVPARVLVISIPDYAVTPFASSHDTNKITTEVAAYNSINAQLAQQGGALYANITPISRLATHQPQLLANDDLHPSAEQYALWVSIFLPFARSILSRALTSI